MQMGCQQDLLGKVAGVAVETDTQFALTACDSEQGRVPAIAFTRRVSDWTAVVFVRDGDVLAAETVKLVAKVEDDGGGVDESERTSRAIGDGRRTDGW